MTVTDRGGTASEPERAQGIAAYAQAGGVASGRARKRLSLADVEAALPALTDLESAMHRLDVVGRWALGGLLAGANRVRGQEVVRHRDPKGQSVPVPENRQDGQLRQEGHDLEGLAWRAPRGVRRAGGRRGARSLSREAPALVVAGCRLSESESPSGA